MKTLRPRMGKLALVFLVPVVACAGKVAAPVVVATPSASAAMSAAPARCLELDGARRDVAAGMLRAAAWRTLDTGSFCEPKAARRLRAEVLLDLAHYEDARGLIEELDADDLRKELRRRTTPASPEAIDASRKHFAAGELIEAWETDSPNGLALIHAALARRTTNEPGDVRSLLERGTAELERETGRKAHVGVRQPPVCGGHFSNYLTAAWLADSRHAVIHCTDASAIIDTATNERVANHDARGLDLARLPRLRFTDTGANAAEREHDCSASVTARVRVDADRGELVSSKPALTQVLADVFRTTFKDLTWDKQYPVQPEWTMQCIEDPEGNERILVRALLNLAWGEAHATALFDPSSNRFMGSGLGKHAHFVSGGRLAIRGPQWITLIDRTGKMTREKLEGGDLSDDGTKVLFVKQEGGDEMFRPVWPYFRERKANRKAQLLGDFRFDGREAANVLWPMIGPFTPTDCANTGTMPGQHRPCSHAGIRLDGVDFDSTSEIDCDVHYTPKSRSPEEEDLTVTCRDPRGPVKVDNPFDREYVCRIGPHVLPLGACPHLLKE